MGHDIVKSMLSEKASYRDLSATLDATNQASTTTITTRSSNNSAAEREDNSIAIARSSRLLFFCLIDQGIAPVLRVRALDTQERDCT